MTRRLGGTSALCEIGAFSAEIVLVAGPGAVARPGAVERDVHGRPFLVDVDADRLSGTRFLAADSILLPFVVPGSGPSKENAAIGGA